ncbi:MAG: DUF58 domain-containing protein [Thermoanaerobaculia bacterium]
MPRPLEFHGVVRLTSIGAGYLAFTFVIGFAALNTGNNALYIALSFMLGALIVSGVASKGALKHHSVSLGGVGEAWAGEPVHARLWLSNHSRFWAVRDLVIVSREMARPVIVARLGRRSKSEVDVSFLFQRRGRIAFKTIDLYTRYPFGLFLKKRKVHLDGEAIVYPRLLETSGEIWRHMETLGDSVPQHRSGQSGSGVYGYREYMRGDSLRRIHWKRSASLGRWIIKQPEREVRRAIAVVVDPVLPPGRSEEDFEGMISAAATYLRDALATGSEVTLHVGSMTIEGAASGSQKAMFEALALVEAVRDAPMPLHERGMAFFSLRRSDAAKTA